jgi:hypothetical protein
VLNLVVDTLRRVEDSLGRLSENVTLQLSRLPSDYVPRREAERRLDELTLDIAAEEQERLAAIKELKDDIEAAKARQTTAHRFLIATSVAAITGLLTTAASVITHYL